VAPGPGQPNCRTQPDEHRGQHQSRRHRAPRAASLEHLEYREFLSFWYQNLLRYFEKHYGKSSTLFLRALILVGMPARMLAGIFVRPKPSVGRKDALAAYWRVMRESL